jgi:hypothetical protein
MDSTNESRLKIVNQAAAACTRRFALQKGDSGGTNENEKNGRPGPIRTGDPLLRRQMLYPPELRAHAAYFISGGILPVAKFFNAVNTFVQLLGATRHARSVK